MESSLKKCPIFCPKCNSSNIFVAYDMTLTRRCASCNHEWLPSAKNVWRIERCAFSPTGDNKNYRFSIFFECGESITTIVPQSVHSFNTLSSIKDMIQDWRNGDGIVEMVTPEQTNVEVSSAPGYEQGMDDVFVSVFDEVNNAREQIIKNNPVQGYLSPVREGALMLIERLTENLIKLEKKMQQEVTVNGS